MAHFTKKPYYVEAIQVKESLEKHFTVKEGDWLVQLPSGKIVVMTNEEFEEEYESEKIAALPIEKTGLPGGYRNKEAPPIDKAALQRRIDEKVYESERVRARAAEIKKDYGPITNNDMLLLIRAQQEEDFNRTLLLNQRIKELEEELKNNE